MPLLRQNLRKETKLSEVSESGGQCLVVFFDFFLLLFVADAFLPITAV